MFKLDAEKQHDLWVELDPPPANSKRGSTLRGKKTGELSSAKAHLRIIISRKQGHGLEPRDRLPTEKTEPVVERFSFGYNGVNQFKSGDVLMYSGCGLVQSMMKLQSNSDFNHMGVVVVLPNLYTGQPSLYVAEVTANYEKMADAFAEKRKKGFCLFRLYERLHQFHGGEIQLLPLKNELTKREYDAMVAWIWQLHVRGFKSSKEKEIYLNDSWQHFLKKDMGFKMEKKPEFETELFETASTAFVRRCLVLSDQISSKEKKVENRRQNFKPSQDEASDSDFVFPCDLALLPCFGTAISLRSHLSSASSFSSTSSQTFSQLKGTLHRNSVPEPVVASHTSESLRIPEEDMEENEEIQAEDSRFEQGNTEFVH